MKRLVVLALLVAACGDNSPGAGVDAHIDSPPADMAIDSDIDAMIDAMPTPSERIALARALPDGTVSFGIVDATITYIKPVIAGATVGNDPGGFTIQVDPMGPALMIEADVTMLTPTPAVGDVVSFTIGEMKTAGNNGSGLMRRGAMITNYTRTTAATDIAPLVQNVTATADLASMVADFESEVIDATVTIADNFGNSGNAFQRAHVTTTGVTTVDNNLQLRLPTAFKDSLIADKELVTGCTVAIHRTPVNRFSAQFQISAFNDTDLTVTSCPAPTVTSAVATDSTHVTITFTRNISATSLMADGSQFTISDGTNALAVTAATLATPRTVTLTTAAQTSSTSYTVTVGNTVTDLVGDAVGTPNTATFTGFVVPVPTVMMAVATDATHVTITFTRDIATASVMADGSQFTIVDDATTPNPLAVTAASVSGMTVTLTTAAQTPGTMYTVTVPATVTDTNGTGVGTPNTAMFTGFVVVAPSVMMATATDATTVTVTFTRNLDAASVMTDGSQFTIVDDATPTPNTLAVTAASVSGMVVTLTTAAQTPGTMYTVTVATTVTGGGMAVTAPLSGMFTGFAPATGVNHLVINEIDYDNNGTDNAVFIEILNPTASAISLVGKRVVLVNGDTSGTPALYSMGAGIFDLGSLGMLEPGQYLVIGASTLVGGLPSTVKTLAFPGTQDQVQNGPRDSAYLIDVGNMSMSIAPTIIDSVSYESNTSANLTYTADGQQIVLAPEGTASTTAVDVNNATASICRSPNGADTNDNSVDIKLCSMLTPGAANAL